MACLGAWATALGPALQPLSVDFDRSLDATGFLLSALFAGSITGSAAVALGLARVAPGLLLRVGMLLAVAGLIAFAIAPNLELAAAAWVLVGLGDGLIVASAHNVVVAGSSNPARDLNRLNLFFAVGAVFGPAWTGLAFEVGLERPVPFVTIGLVALVASVAIFRTPIGHGGAHVRGLSFGWARDARALAMAALLFLYVGSEYGLGTWIAAFVSPDTDETLAGGLVASAYWASLLAGRVTGVFVFGRGMMPVRGLAGVLSLAGLASLGLGLSAGNLWIGLPLAMVTGWAFGPVWPTAFAIAERAARNGGTAALVTVGNASGIVLPWLQGRILVEAGPSQGMFVTAFLCVAMLSILAGSVFATGERRMAAR